jgi:hypothetical protein
LEPRAKRGRYVLGAAPTVTLNVNRHCAQRRMTIGGSVEDWATTVLSLLPHFGQGGAGC